MANSRPTAGRARLRQGRAAGQTLVETALALIVLVPVLVAMCDLARVFITYTNLFNATREGARLGMVAPWDTADIEARIRDCSLVEDPEAISVQIVCDTGSGTSTFVCGHTGAGGSGAGGRAGMGNRVLVTVNYALTPLTPFLGDLMGPINIGTEAVRTIAIDLSEDASWLGAPAEGLPARRVEG